MRKVFWGIISLLCGAAVFSLGDMLDLIKNPELAFAGFILAIVLLLVGFFVGAKGRSSEDYDD